MTERRYLSVAEAAKTLGVSESLVYDAIASGRIRAVQFGRRKLVPTAAIDELEGEALDGWDPGEGRAWVYEYHCPSGAVFRHRCGTSILWSHIGEHEEHCGGSR